MTAEGYDLAPPSSVAYPVELLTNKFVHERGSNALERSEAAVRVLCTAAFPFRFRSLVWSPVSAFGLRLAVGAVPVPAVPDLFHEIVRMGSKHSTLLEVCVIFWGLPECQTIPTPVARLPLKKATLAWLARQPPVCLSPRLSDLLRTI